MTPSASGGIIELVGGGAVVANAGPAGVVTTEVVELAGIPLVAGVGSVGIDWVGAAVATGSDAVGSEPSMPGAARSVSPHAAIQTTTAAATIDRLIELVPRIPSSSSSPGSFLQCQMSGCVGSTDPVTLGACLTRGWRGPRLPIR
jgi:hypothetical protein